MTKDTFCTLARYLKGGGDGLNPSGAAALDDIDAILEAVRDHLGMEIAFASRFVDGRREFTHISATIPVPAAPGDSEPLEHTLCQRILEGKLPELIRDAQSLPVALEFALTRALPIGAHINVPLRLADGRIYGSFCCVSRSADPSLTTRDLDTVKAFAQLAARKIDRSLAAEQRLAAIRHHVERIVAANHQAMVYQPIYSLANRRVCGVEALSRFAGDDFASPSDWFAAAAEVGLGVELELHAVRNALCVLPMLPADVYLSVNASPTTIADPRLAALLGGVGRDRLMIEITEHMAVADYAALSTALDHLRPLARIAIDDVGAGYAGLRHIVDLAPDLLKLDMCLTHNVDRDPVRGALVEALVSLAAQIGCGLVAEGVETPQEEARLRTLGVRFAQGFCYQRPAPALVIERMLLAQRDPPVRALSRPRVHAAG